MLAFFRRAFNSKVVLIILGLIAIAVVVTGVGTPSGLGFGGGGGSGDTVAKVGGQPITATEVSRRADSLLANARQQQPGATMAMLVAQGGVESMVDELAGVRALEIWAERNGFVASDKLVEGEIASIPAFAGPTGKFDDATFRRVLAQARVAEPQMRADVRGDVLRRLILTPVAGGAQAPRGLVLPYASLLLERRTGSAAIVPTQAMPAGPAPTDAEIATWYGTHLAAYSLPERRVLRMARIAPGQAQAAAPTDAEIAADYRANAAQYAAKESRTLSQLTLPTEAAARAASAKIRGGAGFAAVAQAAGFAPADTAIGTLDHAGLTARSGAAAATAAFALADRAVSDPVRSTLGWVILRVDGIRSTPARSLDQARGEITARLAQQKRAAAFTDLVGSVQDAVDGGSTFDEVAKTKGLAVQQTPPLTAQGSAPGVPGFTPAPELAALLKPAFDASPDDEPTIEQLPQNGGALLLKVAQVIPAAPVPLAQAKAAVTRDLLADRAQATTRRVAQQIAAKVNGGMSLAAAIGASGVRLPAPQPIGARQADLSRNGAPVPPALTMLFTMKANTARVAPAPGGQGWFIVQLTQVEKGDAAGQPQIVTATQGEFGRLLGNEYAEEFARAVQRELGATRDPAAIERLKTTLRTGQAAR